MRYKKISFGKQMIRHIKDNIRRRTGYREQIDSDKYLSKNETIDSFCITLENKDSVRQLLAFEKKHMAECGCNSLIPCFTYRIEVTVGGDIWKVSCPCGAYIELDGNFSAF